MIEERKGNNDMLTTLDWQLTVALAFATWIGLILFHRLFRRLTWPKWMRPIDLATLVAWWAIEVISFQVWHLSLLPILFMFVLWGIGLAFVSRICSTNIYNEDILDDVVAHCWITR